MVFKLAIASIAFATAASAAITKRVTCPDGNVTSNQAVSNTPLGYRCKRANNDFRFIVLRFLPIAR